MAISTLRETASLCDTPYPTFIRWRQLGLIPPPKETAPNGSMLFYDSVGVERVRKAIKKLRELNKPQKRGAPINKTPRMQKFPPVVRKSFIQ